MVRRVLVLTALTCIASLARADEVPSTTVAKAPTSDSKLPAVTDPMLAEVPRAPREVETWTEALESVRRRSTDLRTAFDEVLRARAQERIAMANLLPTVTGNVTAEHQSGLQLGGFALSSQALNTLSVGAQLQQTLVNFQQFYALGTAKASTRAAELSRADEARTLAITAANAVVGVVTAERVAEINRVGLRQSLERLDLTRRKQVMGSATVVDVVRAQQDVESARTTLISGDEALRKSRETLGLAMGLSTQVGVARDIRIEVFESDARRACRSVGTVDDRSDVLAQQKRVVAARRQIDDVWLQFAPQLAAQGSASELDTSAPGGSSVKTWSIEAVLTVPIWDGGARYGALRNARAVADEAAQTLEADRRQASIQVDQARRAVTVAAETLRVQERARDLAARNDELIERMFLQGAMTSLDLVTAAASRRQAEIQYAVDEYDLVEARIDAALALADCGW
jgi:outer membrane protein TolC